LIQEVSYLPGFQCSNVDSKPRTLSIPLAPFDYPTANKITSLFSNREPALWHRPSV